MKTEIRSNAADAVKGASATSPKKGAGSAGAAGEASAACAAGAAGEASAARGLSAVRAFRRAHDMGDVYVRDIDKVLNHLMDARGRRFAEMGANVWGKVGARDRAILYCGTGRHGGGVMLRPLFLRVDEGTWLNATTGRPAPTSLLGPACAASEPGCESSGPGCEPSRSARTA